MTRTETQSKWEELKRLVWSVDCELLYCIHCGTPMVTTKQVADRLMDDDMLSHRRDKNVFKCCDKPFILWLVPPFTPSKLPDVILDVTHFAANVGLLRLLTKL